MRIRNRFPPTAFSSVTASDPQLSGSPVVQQPPRQSGLEVYCFGNPCVQDANTSSQPSDPPNQPFPPSSEHRPVIGIQKAGWVCVGGAIVKEPNPKEIGCQGVKDERWIREEEKSNDTRKGSISGAGAEVGSGDLQPSGSSHQVGRWCEGDKVVPLKKRRERFETVLNKGTPIVEENHEKKAMKAKMKSKTNKKWAQKDADDEQEQDDGKESKNKESKKCKRGSVIMEGSRCSRVNGRGWRCCQQTLVGYSLCEHHLGKGRLRSMASVRSRAMASTIMGATKKKVEPEKLEIYDDSEDEEEDDGGDGGDDGDNEKKPLTAAKKRMKLGTVKARSISSLLGLANSAVVVADNKNQ